MATQISTWVGCHGWTQWRSSAHSVGNCSLEMEKFKSQAGEKDQGAVALVLDLAKAFERVSLPVVWAWATHFSIPGKIMPLLCAGTSIISEAFSLKDALRSRSGPPRPFSQVEVELLACAQCVAGCVK